MGGSTVRGQDLERLRMEDADAASGKQGDRKQGATVLAWPRHFSRLSPGPEALVDTGSAAVVLQVWCMLMVYSVW